MIVEQTVPHNWRRVTKHSIDVEGKFSDVIEEPRKWGIREAPFIYHKGETYLEYIIIDSGFQTFTDENGFVDDGDIPTIENNAAKQLKLKNKVFCRQVNLKNIVDFYQTPRD